MEIVKTKISNIPAIIWGEKSDKAYIFVHGKLSCKEYAHDFAEIACKKGYQVISFDLPQHGERKNEDYRFDTINGISEVEKIGTYVFSHWSNVSLFACSIGAYFCLNAFADKTFSNCLFLSPILDMDYLIEQMFVWFGASAERLRVEKEISTAVDTMYWDSYLYTKNHPIKKWHANTKILYGAKDNLQPIDIIRKFANTFNAQVTVSKQSEHPFMGDGDVQILQNWFEENI